jgi:pimeloyl-ACP methyl ester carboxylesterase
MFRGVYPISYEVASSSSSVVVVGIDGPTAEDDVVVPILLLNGFGVGTFHQHRLMRRLLLEGGRSSRQGGEGVVAPPVRYLIYGVDYLGQGLSWPTDCDDGRSDHELGLSYSADTWLEQLGGFLGEVVVPSSSQSSPGAHLVGNSVGGYLATMLARRHPSLVSSLSLLNATPVWGLNLPGWDGRLPPPAVPRFVGRKLFDVIRDPGVIDMYLEAAYVHREAFDGTHRDGFFFDDGCGGGGSDGGGGGTGARAGALGAKIRACTEGGGGHAAFASILWSAPASERRATDGPRGGGGGGGGDDDDDGDGEDDDDLPTTAVDFYRALGDLGADVLLLFGADDPWCTPAIAKRMHAAGPSDGGSGGGGAARRPPARRYVSLDSVGHCPNHEAPTAVARVLLSWIGATPSSSGCDGDNDDRGGVGSSRRDVPLVSGGADRVSEPWGVVGIREVPIEESRNLRLVDRIVSYMVG